MVLNVVGSNPTGHPQIKKKDRTNPVFFLNPTLFSIALGLRFTVLRTVLLRLFPYKRFVLLYKGYIDETLAAMKEADNLTKVDMSNYESFLKSLE